MSRAPDKGIKGGECFRAFCANRPADYQFTGDGKLYCGTCADKINSARLGLHGRRDGHVCIRVAEVGQTKPVPVLVRMPPDLKARLKELADREHRSLSAQVVALLEAALK